jgi:hypothetical protein
VAPHATWLTRVACFALPPALLLAAAPLARADLTVVARVQGAGPEEERTTTYVGADHVRVSGARGDWIHDSRGGRVVILGLDPRRRTYFETTPAEVAAALARLDEQIRTTPVLARSIGEEGDVQARREGERRTLAGHACDEWVVSMGAANLLELCLAPSLARPDAWIDLMQASYAATGAPGRRVVALLDALRGLAGWPLLFEVETRVRGRKTEIIHEALEVRTDPLDPTIFALPEGYTRIESPFAAPAR